MARDTDEFTAFVRTNTPALLRTAYLITGNALSAEELVQDTLVHLYPKRDKVFAADMPLAYVRRSMVNGFVNSRRRGAAREFAVESLPDIGTDDGPGSRLADRDEVWTLLRDLPERQRAAVVLRYYDDLSDEAIAQALACRTGTVRSLLSRGLAAMRERAGRAEIATDGPPYGRPPGGPGRGRT